MKNYISLILWKKWLCRITKQHTGITITLHQQLNSRVAAFSLQLCCCVLTKILLYAVFFSGWKETGETVEGLSYRDEGAFGWMTFKNVSFTVTCFINNSFCVRSLFSFHKIAWSLVVLWCILLWSFNNSITHVQHGDFWHFFLKC